MTNRIADRRGPLEVEREAAVEMTARDGTVLRADVYRPTAGGPYPALVRRTPYGNRENDLAADFNEAHYFASHGYIVVVQDCRGRYTSDGVWSFDEGPDTYDSIEWAAALPGCTGAVGMFGQSYGALVQYLVAPLQPPHLTTCIPIAGPVPGLPRHPFVELSWDLAYSIAMAEETFTKAGRGDEYEALRNELIDRTDVRFASPRLELLQGLPLTAWHDRHPEIAARLTSRIEGANQPIDPADPTDAFARITVPILHIGSWYDNNQWMTTTTYQGMRDHAGTELARNNQAILMGPWAHLLPYNLPTSGGTGDIDFGPEAATFLLDAELEWFDHYLKQGGTELPRTPVRIFVMGENTWRDEQEWPPARAARSTWYLHSDGDAAGAGGTLTGDAPSDEPADTYVYDPNDPTPTRGGHDITLGGVFDQRPVEERGDVLVYTSEPFDHDVELVGPAEATLHVSTSAPDTDFFVRVIDVRPDGYAHNLLEGGVRLRHRTPGTIEMVAPDEVVEVTVNLWNGCHVVRAGHRLRVDITSSDFPRFDRNANSGLPIGSDTELHVATQTVHHDTTRPTRVVLSVIDR